MANNFIEVKDILEQEEPKTTDFIGYRDYDSVEAAERLLVITKTIRYLKEELHKSRNLIPVEARKNYNAAYTALVRASEIEEHARKYGD